MVSVARDIYIREEPPNSQGRSLNVVAPQARSLFIMNHNQRRTESASAGGQSGLLVPVDDNR